MQEVHIVLREGSATEVLDVLNAAFENSKHITGNQFLFTSYFRLIIVFRLEYSGVCNVGQE